MIQTFDCILQALRDKNLYNKFVSYMERDGTNVLMCSHCLMRFDSSSDILTIEPALPDSAKIIPAKVPYNVLRRMIDGNWNDLNGIEYLCSDCDGKNKGDGKNMLFD